jgi:DNA-binding LytR/AlgR family response regulator
MKILVLEDEAVFANLVTLIIHKLGYELIAVVDNGIDFLRLFKATKPDLALLDVRVHGDKDGIEVAGELQKNSPDTPFIFITSHEEQEIFQRAKQTNPYAYITKPFNEGMLQRTIELVVQQHAKNIEHKETTGWTQDIVLSDSFFIKTGDKLEKIKIEDILYIEADAKYIVLFTAKKQVASRMGLQEILEKLPAQQFVQIHRKHIVNLQFVENINLKNLEIEVGGKRLTISKRQKEHFVERLNKLA